jgi:hypothetical protein
MQHFPAGFWCCDFEFQREDYREHPVLVCMTALEVVSGAQVRLFQEELLACRSPPFPIGADACLVAYSSGAEASCFAVLGWPPPVNVVDPYAEHLLDLNGQPGRFEGDTQLLKAMARHRLPTMAYEHKEAMRNLVRFQSSWNAEERKQILDYCMEDNEAARDLLRVMDAKGLINCKQAIWRGNFMFACGGHIEHHGLPLDVGAYEQIQDAFPRLRHALIASGDTFGVFVDDHRNEARINELIRSTGLAWPLTETGKYKMDEEIWKEMAWLHPPLEPLCKMMNLLDQLRNTKLAIGSDGHNRFWVRPLLSKTGRNQPSTSENILGNAKWWRGLITPPKGWAVVEIDYSGQENVIAAGRSGCPTMQREVASGDIHLATAISLGLAPAWATAETHPAERNQAKPMSHGANYGISAYGVSRKLGISLQAARTLLRRYDATHPVFREWQRNVADRAHLAHRITAPMGWSMYVNLSTPRRTLLNWIMQSCGGEMLRAAVVLLIREGFIICATAHDSILFLIPLDDLAERVAVAQELMERVSLTFTDGLVVPTKIKIVRPGERLLDKETRPMWERIIGLAGIPKAAGADERAGNYLNGC